MTRFLLTIAAIPVLVVAPFSAKTTKPSSPYPNELPGFKLYSKYLYPLRPTESVRAQVVMVLGSDQRIEAGQWWIAPGFLVERIASQNQVTINRLESITITPRQRVSMSGVSFPAVFTHSLGRISESDGCSCDVYSDRFGLQYWLYADDSSNRKKTDLLHIVYGPAR